MPPLAPPYPLIREGLSKARVIPFLGAGASLGERDAQTAWSRETPHLPAADELARHLAAMTGFPGDEQPDLAKVAQYYHVVGGRDRLDEELRGIFDRDYVPGALHHYLASVPIPLLIVTTNYDDLIERAFDAVGRPYDVVVHTTSAKLGERLLWWPQGMAEPREVNANKLDVNLGAGTVIYKMHGAVDRRQTGRDQYVITEDDYVDFLARMTKNKAVPAIFAEPFNIKGDS